jgi:hypothetical protein
VVTTALQVTPDTQFYRPKSEHTCSIHSKLLQHAAPFRSNDTPSATQFTCNTSHGALNTHGAKDGREIQEYDSLIEAILSDKNGCRYRLEQVVISRTRDGVLNIHAEIVQFQGTYGSSIFGSFDYSLFEYVLADS